MTELITWLRAQLDTDERAARAAREGPWALRRHESSEDEIYSVPREERLGGDSNVFPDVWHEGSAAHVLLHDPARVLRQVQAHRAILGEHEPLLADGFTPTAAELVCETCKEAGARTYMAVWPCDTIRALASIYSDRDGYGQEWSQ